ncbi:hypothetical protein KR084_009214, partial [Drosophila pseudotakahashii]
KKFKMISLCILYVMVLSIVFAERMRGPEERIVGGKPVEHDIHWQVALLKGGKHDCGGVIYSERIVLTAAHCVYGKNIEDLSVRAGSSYWNKGGQLVNITKSISHAKFNYSMFTHDIAVLLLSSPLKFDNFTRNIELAESTPKAGTPAQLSGWGIQYFAPNAEGPDKLQALIVYVKDRKKCQKAYNILAELLAEDNHNDIPEDHICASSSGNGACSGDSGGPLVSLLPAKLIGIVSSGFRCLTPDFYTDVAFFKTWIEKTVKSLQC